MGRVGDMTREELKALVGEMVEERITPLVWKNGGRRWLDKGAETGRIKRWREISQAIDQVGWAPLADSQTPHELLRADRAR